MGKGWMQSQTASAHTFAAADEIVDLGDAGSLSKLCFEGPADTLNRTDVSQPALFTTAVALVALVAKLRQFWSQSNWPLTVVATLMLALTLWMLLEGFAALRRQRRAT